MDGFVVTRCSQLKNKSDQNFLSIDGRTVKKPKDKNPINGKNNIYNGKDNDNKQKQFTTEQTDDSEREMKKFRWDVMKFASSNLPAASKHKANVALAISLGAKPPKNRRMNYKRLLEKKNIEKMEAEKLKEQSPGLMRELGRKQMTRTKKKVNKDKVTGILRIYGKIRQPINK